MLALFSYGRCSNSCTTWMSTLRVASRNRSHSLSPSSALSCLLLGPETFSQGPAALAPSLLSACLKSTREGTTATGKTNYCCGEVRSGATGSNSDLAAEGRLTTRPGRLLSRREGRLRGQSFAFTGHCSSGGLAPTADLREWGSIVVDSIPRRRRKDHAILSRQTLGYRSNPHSARRGEANFNKLRELQCSEPTWRMGRPLCC